MAKRKTDLGRITEFFMSADETTARTALDTANTIVNTRFKKADGEPTRKRGGGRRKKTDQATESFTEGAR